MTSTAVGYGSVLAGHRATFRAVARTVVPEAESLGAGGWAALESIVEHALAARPPGLRRQLRLFLRVIDLLPVPRTGRRFRGLEAAARHAILERLERSRLLLLRRGFWGLRTLVLMGYYARPEAATAIGYHASALGWEAPGSGTPAPVPEEARGAPPPSADGEAKPERGPG